MDKKIKAISKKVSKDSKSEKKELKVLEKADKKRDKMVDLGKKAARKMKAC